MSRYIQILSLGPPMEYGIDSSNRTMFSTNFECTIEPSDPAGNISHEIVNYLSSHAFANPNVDTFIGRSVVLPSGTGSDGPYTIVVNTGGAAPIEVRKDPDDPMPAKYEQHSFQITIRGVNALSAANKANAIFLTLDGLRDVVLT